ncbi:MAG: DUF3159 domain-containing protein [Micrococcales bacterium]|nr:DUF3159 domain-containing protein [Micrococcales bacterium]
MAADLPAPSVHPLPTVEEVIRHRLSSALGGWRGSVETALPMVVFVVVWTATKDVRTAVVASLAAVGLLAAIRLAQRQTLQYVLSALIATAIAAFFALRSGRAEDAFLPGIIGSGAWSALTLVSIAARWPVIGFMVGAGDPRLQEDPFGWRRDPAMVAVCSRLTWVLAAIYLIRVGLMLPLYLAGNVAMLGVAKVVLGWPLWLGALAVMGAILMRGRTPQLVETADSDETYAEHEAQHPADPA